ncbi:MAG TPA: NAD(P)-dependent oxidoreductase [bacterium]|nr:NAD(P)-dependent oxidoreductase [bacterium]
MRVYVTGGTGFIGSYMVKELSDKKYQVVVLARNPSKVPSLASLSGVKIVKADMLDFSSLKNALKEPGALIHTALCWGDTGPEMILNETLNSVRLIELAIKRGAKKIIYTSSTAAAGMPEGRDKTESDIRKPSDFYGASKGSVELYISAYSSYFRKVKFNIVRPGYTFGNPVVPGAPMEPDSRFRDICSAAIRSKKIELIKNDGTQFIWAGSLARVYSALLNSGISNEIFFGLSRNFITWEQIAKWAVKYSGSSSKIITEDLGWSSAPSCFSVKKIESALGLSFNSTPHVKEHIKYLLGEAGA